MLDIRNINLQNMLKCSYSIRLLEKLKSINKKHVKSTLKISDVIDIDKVKKSIIYTKYYHGIQTRDSGEPFYTHPLEVAYMVSDYIIDTDIIITAVLHDTLEDTKLTKHDISEAFGLKISNQVYDLTRIKENGTKITSAELIQNLWIQKKRDLLMVKLFDRMHNIQTLQYKSFEKRSRIIEETILHFLLLAADVEELDIEDKLYQLCLAACQKNHDFSQDFGNFWQDYSY